MVCKVQTSRTLAASTPLIPHVARAFSSQAVSSSSHPSKSAHFRLSFFFGPWETAVTGRSPCGAAGPVVPSCRRSSRSSRSWRCRARGCGRTSGSRTATRGAVVDPSCGRGMRSAKLSLETQVCFSGIVFLGGGWAESNRKMRRCTIENCETSINFIYYNISYNFTIT